MNGENTSGYMIRYQYQGNDRVMTFKTLANGMKLVICDSYTEVFSGRKQLIDWIVILRSSSEQESLSRVRFSPMR